jgi:hypothetical protein
MTFTPNFLRTLCVSMALISATSFSFADAVITSNTQSFIEYERRDMNGVRKVSREPVTNINLGDDVVFVNFIKNSGDMPAYNFSITSEIPVGSRLLSNGITLNDNLDVSISTSGNTWFPWKLASGNLTTARYISWSVKQLNAGDSLELAFKISVDGTKAAPITPTKNTPTPTDIIETTVIPSLPVASTTEIPNPVEKEETPTPETSVLMQDTDINNAVAAPQRTAAPLSDEAKAALEQQFNDNAQ